MQGLYGHAVSSIVRGAVYRAMKGMDMEKRLMSWTGILPVILILVFGLASFPGQARADDCTDFTKKGN